MLRTSRENPQSLHVVQAAAPSPDTRSKITQSTLSLITGTETAEQWRSLETVIAACLKTGDDKSAHLLLERLVDRFGQSNERVTGLRGLYQEAVAANTNDLEKVLAEYENVLMQTPANVSIAKRRVAILKNLYRQDEAAKALVAIIEMSPTDAEAWAELSDIYLSLGMFSHAEYCLEEVLLITPNAWNVHARLGEVLLISAISEPGLSSSASSEILSLSLQRYCRSTELCNDYLRGLIGLKLVSDKIIDMASDKSSQTRALPVTIQQVRDINQKAMQKISNIHSATAFNPESSELIAAKTILDRS